MCNNSPAVATSLENGWRNQGHRQGGPFPLACSIGRAWNIGQRFDWTRVEHWTAFRLDSRGTLDSVEPARGILKLQETKVQTELSRTKKAKF